MPSLPLRDSTKDRSMNFVAGRILDADELNRLQQIDSSIAANEGLGALFVNGGTMNITAAANGASVTLAPTNPAQPMQVFLNGNWETIRPVTLSYAPGKTSGTDYVYLNYVLWRVTLNTAGTINDPMLQDIVTGQPNCEIGQLQLTVDTADASVQGTGVTIDPATQLDKNAVPIPMFTLVRGSSPAITLQTPDRVQPGTVGDSVRSGFLKLSHGSSGVALAADDPVLAKGPVQSVASTASTLTIGVVPPMAQNPAANSPTTGKPLVQLDDTHGIEAKLVVHQGTANTVEDLASYLMTTLANVQNQAAALQTQATAVQTQANYLQSEIDGLLGVKPPDLGNLPYAPSSHVGLALGQSTSHPSSLNTDTSGWTVRRGSSGAGAGNNHCYELTDKDGNLLFSVGHDGEVYSKPSDAFSINSAALGKLSAIASALATVAASAGGPTFKYVDDECNAAIHTSEVYTDQKIAGLTGSGGVQQSYVDQHDASTLASAQANAAQQIQTALAALKFPLVVAPPTVNPYPGSGSGWARLNSSKNNGSFMNWCFFGLGNLTVGFGAGALADQDTLEIPPGFASNQMYAHAAAGVIPIGGNATTGYFGFPGGTMSGQVSAFTTGPAGQRLTGWANVFAFCWHM